MANGHLTPWRFDPQRIWVERAPSGRVVMLRHTAYPFPGGPTASHDFAGLAKIANAYLRLVWAALEAPTIWLEDILSSAGDSDLMGFSTQDAQTGLPYLRWLPFGSAKVEGEPFEPRGSAWITRRNAEGVIDQTAVLMGVLSVYKAGEWVALYGHQGIRVVVHVAPTVRITGLTTTLPHSTLKFIKRNGKPAKDWAAARQAALEAAYREKPVAKLPVGEPGWRIYPPPDPVPGPDVQKFEVGLGKRLRKPLVVARVPGLPRVAHANVTAKVYTQDLMARYGADKFRDTRPGRSWEDSDWVSQPLPPVRETLQLDLNPVAGAYELQNPGPNPRVRVSYSRFSLADRAALDAGVNEDDAKQVTAAELSTSSNRSDAASAASAFYHANDLFVRLGRWSLDLGEVFRFVQLPLLVRYRYGMLHGPGRDGRTVNAMVTINTNQAPWQIETRFGLADLSSSSQRSPLGLVCDPRWNWHEFGHVLLAGSVGELEFRFGHSAGDALAAILLDPKSKLATHPDWRYVSFPWVSQPRRRHDREVARGWSWNGAMYQRERFFADEGQCAKAGYWAEQLLSTTLFRLYRALGGDTEQPPGLADEGARQGAAEYTAFLIARAIVMLGDAASVPAMSPDQFASALMDADAATAKFDDGLFNTGRRSRVGGAARKVVRWAFQQQGLYAKSTDGLPTARPGDEEPVDLHIADMRDKTTQHAPGTYAPIRLPQDWHAHKAALWVRRAADGQSGDQVPKAGQRNFVYVNVENLGASTTNDAAVYVWSAKLGRRGLDDPNLQWRLVGSVGALAVAGRAVVKAGPIEWDLKDTAADDKAALLVAVNCSADPANVDKGTGLPCAFPHALDHAGPFKIHSPIDQLVAYDNNLGLRQWKLA